MSCLVQGDTRKQVQLMEMVSNVMIPTRFCTVIEQRVGINSVGRNLLKIVTKHFYEELLHMERWEDPVRDYEFLRRELPGDSEVAESLERAKTALMNRSQESKSLGFNNEVEVVSTMDKFKNAVSLPGVSVFHFKSSSNRQCKEISPFINTLCIRYPLVQFFKVDVEETLAWAKTESVGEDVEYQESSNIEDIQEWRQSEGDDLSKPPVSRGHYKAFPLII